MLLRTSFVAQPAGRFLKQTISMYDGPYPPIRHVPVGHGNRKVLHLVSSIAFVHRYPANALMSPCSAVFWFSAAGPAASLVSYSYSLISRAAA